MTRSLKNRMPGCWAKRPGSARVERRAEEGFGFSVLVFVDDIVIGLHHHPDRIAQHRRRHREILGLFEKLGGPDGPNEVRIKALPGAHGDDGREFQAQGGLAERGAAPRQEDKRGGRGARQAGAVHLEKFLQHRQEVGAIVREIHVVRVDLRAPVANFEIVAAEVELPVPVADPARDAHPTASRARCAGAAGSVPGA